MRSPGGPTRDGRPDLADRGGVWGIRVDRGTTVGVEETHIDPDGPRRGERAGGDRGTIVRGGTTFAVVDPESAWREVRATIEGWYGSDCGRSWRRAQGAAEGGGDA
jgi:hypothetical protein